MAPIVCGGGGEIWVCSLFYRAVLSVLSNFAIIFDGEKRAVYLTLSYDVASGSEITPCNKICKPLVVYRFTGNVITSITTLRT